MGGSTMYSLSLLTSNMWAVVIRIFFYNQKVGYMYYISFAIVVLGLTIYSINSEENEASANSPHLEEESEKNIKAPLLGEEGHVEVLSL
ncbi:uncharacterized solute carrier family 35 member C320.08-like [Impatiens glandulifera]|uniref:uncharacterized solute carrier family 35 member C320.08-like n=1 Tax=Impatiens glandulifera TaxID=253017 RepID=UPI001FB11E5F|nr:uncharacterized solute carrier family 35 member C320.08-like [Impatiens glandulifera]